MVASIYDLMPMEIESSSDELKNSKASFNELPLDVVFEILNSIPIKNIPNIFTTSRTFTSCSAQILDIYLKKMLDVYKSLPYLSNEFKEADYSLPTIQQIEKLKHIFNSQDATGRTPLIRTTISMKVKPSDASTLTHLLNFGADPNGLGKNGWTALHYAAFWSNNIAWNVLVDAGANPHLKTIDTGKTPLEFTTKAKANL